MSRSAASPEATQPGGRTGTVGRAPNTGFDLLRAAIADRLPLRALDPVAYAAGHALFEARSDQRAHLTSWVLEHLRPRSAASTRVLSIGCGDGAVDVRVAAALAALGAPVEYLGVEPHAPSARAFAIRLGRVPHVDASTLGCSFDQARPPGRYDVVLAVHSLYYVADLATTLRRACDLLTPGGELVVLHAPREPLNALVRLLAPGRPQAFSGEVANHLRALGRTPSITRIDNRLDLTETGDLETDRLVLDFTVQAQVPPGLERVVRTALRERALPAAGMVLGHPVDALVVRA